MKLQCKRSFASGNLVKREFRWKNVGPKRRRLHTYKKTTNPAKASLLEESGVCPNSSLRSSYPSQSQRGAEKRDSLHASVASPSECPCSTNPACRRSAILCSEVPLAGAGCRYLSVTPGGQ